MNAEVVLTFEEDPRATFQERQQGIDVLTFTPGDGFLDIQGWYDGGAPYGASVRLTREQRHKLAAALEAKDAR